jgi:hypothetical protein
VTAVVVGGEEDQDGLFLPDAAAVVSLLVEPAP